MMAGRRLRNGVKEEGIALTKTTTFKIVSIFFVYMVIFNLGCSGKTEVWEGVVYPDGTDPKNYLNLGTFKSIKNCRAAAFSRLERLDALKVGDYECVKI